MSADRFIPQLLKKAGEELAEELKNTALHTLQIPYVTNVTAEKVDDISATRELLAEQVSSPVRWMQSMENHDRRWRGHLCGNRAGPHAGRIYEEN